MPECLEEFGDYNKYKFKKIKQLFPPQEEEKEEEEVKENQEEEMDTQEDTKHKQKEKKPLTGHSIAVAGKLKQTQSVLNKRIKSLGGTVHSGSVNSSVMCVISSEKEVEKEKNKKVVEALKFGVPIVSIDFIDDCEKEKKSVVYSHTHTHKVINHISSSSSSSVLLFSSS
eukprot:m.140350 g.140350  ORF g.140350 m.140350 type:complete len:170 (+) comp13180_c1_seq4:254-763(+)